mmetsp:Transcript_55394/g.130550  ORF Transcript_55394/g.130550 Transcript_55394/m.130550 type:complete len:249 (+) Transcript_55394:971-1717(+)
MPKSQCSSSSRLSPRARLHPASNRPWMGSDPPPSCPLAPRLSQRTRRGGTCGTPRWRSTRMRRSSAMLPAARAWTLRSSRPLPLPAPPLAPLPPTRRWSTQSRSTPTLTSDPAARTWSVSSTPLRLYGARGGQLRSRAPKSTATSRTARRREAPSLPSRNQPTLTSSRHLRRGPRTSLLPLLSTAFPASFCRRRCAPSTPASRTAAAAPGGRGRTGGRATTRTRAASGTWCVLAAVCRATLQPPRLRR